MLRISPSCIPSLQQLDRGTRICLWRYPFSGRVIVLTDDFTMLRGLGGVGVSVACGSSPLTSAIHTPLLTSNSSTTITYLPFAKPILYTRRMIATLLGLPAELRNRIYGYVLTDPSSTELRCRAFLIINDTICKPLLLGSDGGPFNVLKDVCRQLRTETDGLDLAYNFILIEQYDRNDWPQRKKLYSMLGPYIKSLQPLTFILKERPATEKEPWSDTLALVDWCALHENISIGYILPEFRFFDDSFSSDVQAWESVDIEYATQRMLNFLTCGIYLTVALRGPGRWSESEWTRLGFDLALHATREKLVNTAIDSREGWDMNVHGAMQNFRFLPVDAEVNEMMIKALTCLADNVEVTQEVLREWIEMVKGWF
jgi:hypothetical protein